MLIFALHIPDGFMSIPLAALGWALAVPALTLALYQSRHLEDRFIPMAGLLSAFVFAAQTLQFPIPGGTSGHLVGAPLVAILLGPGMGMVVLTAVLILEAFVFGTGGLLALGWNSVNMAVVMGLLGLASYQSFRSRGATPGRAAFCAAWLSTGFGSLVTCMELAAAETSPLLVSLAAMMSTQSLVGIGEGLVTAGAVSLLYRTRPELTADTPRLPARWTALVLTAILVACALPPRVYGLETQTSAWLRHPALLVALVLMAIWGLIWLLFGWFAKARRAQD